MAALAFALCLDMQFKPWPFLGMLFTAHWPWHLHTFWQCMGLETTHQ